MAYKGLTKGTKSDKVLRDKALRIPSNPKQYGYQRGLASMVYKFFDKKSASGSGVATLANTSAIKSIPNQQLANELYTPLENFKKEKFILHLKAIFGVLI